MMATAKRPVPDAYRNKGPYITIAYAPTSAVTHWVTQRTGPSALRGLITLCGVAIPKTWTVKKGRASLVTCARCQGDR